MVCRLFHLLQKGIVLLVLKTETAFLVGANFRHGTACQHTGQCALDKRVSTACVLIVQLPQKPVFALFAGLLFQADQQPFAAHPFSIQGEMEMALFHVLGTLAFNGRPASAIPQHDCATAIFALGNNPFKFGIGHGVIFGAHGKALAIGIEGRPLGDRPAFQHAIYFQPKVPMQSRCIVFLDDEEVATLAASLCARRLWRLVEITLGIVCGERIGRGFLARHRSGAFLPAPTLRCFFSLH